MNYPQKQSNYRPINWSRKAVMALLTVGIIVGFTFSSAPVVAEEKEITVPINQVVKMEKLSTEQLTKSKVTVPISWVSKEYLEKHSYTKEGRATGQSANEEGWSLIWESDFEEGDRDGFSKAWVDGGVGCEKYPPTREDVLAHAVKDKTTPDGDYVLEIVANPNNEGGTFVNAITVRDVPFEDDHLYKVEGYFKKVPDTKVELLDMELQYINSSNMESYNSFLWYIHKGYEPAYEWVMCPTESNDDFPYKKLFKLDESGSWHKFEFVGRYESNPTSRKILELQIDDKVAHINEEVLTQKHNYSDVFKVLLETHNMYTGCVPERHYTGKSRWDEIKVYKKPIEKE
ncbi:hypothetical protein KGY79_01785 [Candidatus Bipolaricaulota bacterium]|nr:hypothetical protein [Candidatus Bipolaricaulota bacterium]